MLLFNLKYHTKSPKAPYERSDDKSLDDFANMSNKTNDTLLKVLSDTANETLGNLTDSEEFEYVVNNVSILQGILIFWVFCFLLEEFKQVRHSSN